MPMLFFRASGLQKRTRLLPGLKFLLAKRILLVSMTHASARGPFCAARRNDRLRSRT